MPRIFEAPPGFVLNPDYLVPELRAQRDALLEALRDLMARLDPYDYPDEQNFARAAIKAVEEGK